MIQVLKSAIRIMGIETIKVPWKQSPLNENEVEEEHDEDEEEEEDGAFNCETEFTFGPFFKMAISNNGYTMEYTSKKQQKGYAELPPVVENAIVHNTFDNLLPDDIILGYTEVKKQGITYRAHPNYRSEGAWYEWAMIEFVYDNPQELQMRQRENHFPRDEYPSKIVAFLELIREGKCIEKLALVHSCEENDHQMSSVIQEAWKLQYCEEDQQPIFHPVILESIGDRVLVVEEAMGIHEKRPHSSMVHLILDRETFWAGKFN